MDAGRFCWYVYANPRVLPMASAAADPLLQELIAELCERHGCHTVILYGSRARGTHRPDSDYDLLLVRGEGVEEHFVSTWRGLQVDAFVQGESTLDPERDVGLIRIRNGVVLRDEKGFGARLVQRVREVFERGRPPLQPHETVSHRAWVEKMLLRISRRASTPVLADYRRVSLLKELLVIYFDLRGRWFLGEEESLGWLSANDPRAYAAFAEALAPGAPFQAIERLARVVAHETTSGTG
jgi:predicted nucleotidyltransferase